MAFYRMDLQTEELKARTRMGRLLARVTCKIRPELEYGN